MPKAYTVTQISYQYNDETYYATDDHAGEPIQAFTNRKAAEAEARRRNIAELSEMAPSDYSYELSDLFDVQALNEFLAGVTKRSHMVDTPAFEVTADGLWQDSSLWQALIQSLDEEQKGKLYDLINLEFYKVVEIELVS